MMKSIAALLILININLAYASRSSNFRLKSYRSQRSQTEDENSICKCVPMYQCNYKDSMNENGSNLIDIRTGFAGTEKNPQSRRRKCKHYLSVCCLPSEIESAREILKNPVEEENGSFTEQSQIQSKAGGTRKNEKSTGVNGAKHIDRGCGVRNTNGVGFRVLGNDENEANFGEYPWMTAILERRGNEYVYKCGGSLIQERVVLTAAHCVKGVAYSKLLARAGEWDTKTENEPLPHQDRRVSSIIIHPDYQPRNVLNDFALLFVDRPFQMADNVEVACLPYAYENYKAEDCHATGWGKDKFGAKGVNQAILKTITMAVVPQDKCQSDLRLTRLGSNFKLDTSFICAGGVEGVDTCLGDGGSPLVCPMRNDPIRYVQVGIVSWGVGCGKNNIPGVYASVAKARSWIDETLKSYNLDTQSYIPPNNDGIPRMN